MSIESDSRDCLIGAVARGSSGSTGVVLDPGDLNDLKPSSKGFEHDAVSWLIVIEAAAGCLAGKGYEVVRMPTRADAGDLLAEPFTQTVILLTDLVAGPLKRSVSAETVALVAGGVVLGAAAGAAATAASQSSRERKPSRG